MRTQVLCRTLTLRAKTHFQRLKRLFKETHAAGCHVPLLVTPVPARNSVLHFAFAELSLPLNFSLVLAFVSLVDPPKGPSVELPRNNGIDGKQRRRRRDRRQRLRRRHRLPPSLSQRLRIVVADETNANVFPDAAVALHRSAIFEISLHPFAGT